MFVITREAKGVSKRRIFRVLNCLFPFLLLIMVAFTIVYSLVLGGLWMTRSIMNLPGWGSLFNDFVGDGTASVFMATFLFIIPNKRSPGAKLMDCCKQLSWDIVLLLGGGFALAEGIKTSGLSVWISQSFGFLKSTNYAFITPVIALIVSLVTEFTSNNAAATIFLPLLADAALSIHMHPLFLMLTGAISASYAFYAANFDSSKCNRICYRILEGHRYY